MVVVKRSVRVTVTVGNCSGGRTAVVLVLKDVVVSDVIVKVGELSVNPG